MVLLMVFLGIPGVSAEEINVPAQYGTIQAAIDGATAGDTIIVSGGTYNENITVNKQLILTGSGWPVIDGTGQLNDTVRLQTDNVVFGNSVKEVNQYGT